VVWSTVQEDLPQLKQQIEGLLIEYRRERDLKLKNDQSR